MSEVKVAFSLKLKHPVVSGSETVTELKFKKATMGDLGDLKIGSEMSMKSLYPVAAKLSGQPLHIIEGLDPEDGMEVLDHLGKLLPSGRQTSNTPPV